MEPMILGAERATLVLGAALVTLALTRGRSAQLRRMVLVAALFGALSAPLAAYTRAALVRSGSRLPQISIDVGSVPLLDVGADTAGAGAAYLDVARVRPAPAPSAARAYMARARSAGVLEIAGIVWALGALIVFARLVRAHRQIGRLRRAAEPLDEEFVPLSAQAERALGARARVAIADGVGVPFTAGVWRPIVLLPKSAREWQSQRWQAVLRHELAHVRQWDVLGQLVAESCTVVHWFNPLVWWARHRLRIERELAADEHVLQSGLVASSYAGELLRLAAEHASLEMPAAALPGAARGFGFSERVERLVSGRVRPLPSRLLRASVVATASALWFALSCASLAKPSGARAAHVEAAESAARTPDTQNDAPRSEADELANQAARVLGTEPARVELTLDARVQQIAAEETAQAERGGARTATIIVLEPSSGSVLALTNPKMAAANYAPGSTLKTLLLAAALEEGRISLDQSFDCGRGSRRYGPELLRDSGAYGRLSAAQILIRSSNVGASRIFDELGGASFARWFARAHLDSALPIELTDSKPGSMGGVAGEPAGSMRGAIAAMGAGVATSPLHMTAFYAALANDGLYLTPTLVRAVRDDRGAIVTRKAARPERLLRSETARALLAVLEGVVTDEHGTGHAARVEGVPVAGKTGTASARPVTLDVREEDSPPYASFIGVLPVSAPRYVILVGIEGRNAETTGGKSAAPVFARLARRLLVQ